MMAGTEWPTGLLDAMATSQVLVYLLSADYIQSDYCGKELQVFLERVESFRRANPGVAPRFIIPVIWVPIVASTLPLLLGLIQQADDAFPEDYASKGLESLAKRRDKTAYQSFVDTELPERNGPAFLQAPGGRARNTSHAFATRQVLSQ